jgi:hypothetical protein
LTTRPPRALAFDLGSVVTSEAPFFFQIERNNLYDASIGFRYLFLESGVVSANFLVPLNDQGVRADFIPTVEVEYTFSAPW